MNPDWYTPPPPREIFLFGVGDKVVLLKGDDMPAGWPGSIGTVHDVRHIGSTPAYYVKFRTSAVPDDEKECDFRGDELLPYAVALREMRNT